MFLCLQYALPYLRKTRGNIIQTASMVGHFGQAGAVAYCATKVKTLFYLDELLEFMKLNGVQIYVYPAKKKCTTRRTNQLSEISQAKDQFRFYRFKGMSVTVAQPRVKCVKRKLAINQAGPNCKVT